MLSIGICNTIEYGRHPSKFGVISAANGRELTLRGEFPIPNLIRRASQLVATHRLTSTYLESMLDIITYLVSAK